MGFFGGLITFICVIVMLVVSFVLGTIIGFVGLYFAIRKFCPEAWLVLDMKIHSDNKERVEKELAEKESDENVAEDEEVA